MPQETLPVRGSPQSRGWQLTGLAAPTVEALEATSQALATSLETGSPRTPAGLTRADAARTVGPHRRVVVHQGRADAASALRSGDPQRVATGVRRDESPPVVFMFPGGGAQHAGMARGVYAAEPTFREHVDRCARLLEPQLGLDLRTVLYPEEPDAAEATAEIERARVGLPALFVTEYALALFWIAHGVRPSALIGHSLGEYVAACLAGVFSLEDALALVALRGRLLDSLPPGAMLGVAAPEEEILPLLADDLSLAAVNGPSQCVVAGPTEAVDELRTLLVENGVVVRLIHMATAAHSSLVAPVLDEFRRFLEGVRLQQPAIPCVSNLTGGRLGAEAADVGYWLRHVERTVRFADGIGEVLKDGRRVLLEVGPSHTLTTLARQNAANPTERTIVPSLRHPRASDADEAVLLLALGRLWIAGVAVGWGRQRPAIWAACTDAVPGAAGDRERGEAIVA